MTKIDPPPLPRGPILRFWIMICKKRFEFTQFTHGFSWQFGKTKIFKDFFYILLCKIRSPIVLFPGVHDLNKLESNLLEDVSIYVTACLANGILKRKKQTIFYNSN